MEGYIFTHEGRQYTPDGVVQVADVDAHNRELDAAVLAEWANRPAIFGAYATGEDRKVTTWMGATLGTVTRSSTYRNNLGARITCVTVRGTNGATYHGRYGSDWSQFVTLRKARVTA